MRPLLILKTGCTLPSLIPRRGDYEDWIRAGMGLAADRVAVARVFEDDPLPGPAGLAGVVVTGSSAMVSEREAWSERAAGWLATAVAAETPLLGICYGHQLLAHALGGRVGRNPRGREMGTVAVRLHEAARDDALFGALPPTLRVQATHLESVLELPREARPLAWNESDPYHAFAVGASAWGVQFHPEFDAEVIRAYLEARSEVLRAEGIDPAPLLSGVAEAPQGPALLRRFAALLRE